LSSFLSTYQIALKQYILLYIKKSLNVKWGCKFHNS